MTNTTTPAVPPFDPTAVEIPDDEPRQIVCTGEDGSGVWQPGFGTWEHDDFGIDGDEPAGEGERLFVNRRIYDALLRELTVTLACNRGLVRLNEATQARAEAAEAEVKKWETAEPSEQRKKYQTIAAQILVGKASQEDAVRAILASCRDNERLAVISGKSRAERDAAVKRAEAAHEASYIALDEAWGKRCNVLEAGFAAALARAEAAEARVAELEAALPRAWEAGRDAAAMRIVRHEMGTPMHSPPPMLTEAHDAIMALKPPADLAKGGGE